MNATIDASPIPLDGVGENLPSYHDRKVFWDRSFAGTLLVLSLPLLVVLLAIVRLTSSGKAIYRQTRVGKDGKKFRVFKIRTMYDDAEAVAGPQWAIDKDPRVTRVGRALRFLHLDELPQLLNVVRGEMSLIGPRPERPEFVELLSELVPNYRERLRVLPGITGLAQINLPPDDSLESVRRKSIVDSEYMRNADANLDFRILVCTALRMLGVRHGRAPRWLGVEYCFPDPVLSIADADDDGASQEAEELAAASCNGGFARAFEGFHGNGHNGAPGLERKAVAARSKASVASEKRPFILRRPK